MILWSLNYKNGSYIPTIYYKIIKITITDEIEKKLKKEIFKIFYLTHCDAKSKIKEIENNSNENTYKQLYELIFPSKIVKNKFEYLVELLNLFSIEIEGMNIV